MGMALDSSLDERLNSIKRVPASVGSPDLGLSGDYGSYWRAIKVEISCFPTPSISHISERREESKRVSKRSGQ